MSTVAIVLLNYNSIFYTKSCIASITKSQNADHTYSIYVWDNASSETFEDSDCAPALVHHSKDNLGFAGGYNAAVSWVLRTSTPDYLLILNNDTLVNPDLIPKLIEASTAAKDKCLVVPKIYFASGHEFHKGKYHKKDQGKVIWYAGGVMDWNNILPFHWGVDEVDRGQCDAPLETDFVTGCCVLIPARVWRSLKGFNAGYFMYYEDIDLSLRAKKKGYKLLYTPSASVIHINAGSSDGSGSPLHEYYQTRNRLHFGIQYGKFRTKLALLREARHLWKTGTEVQKEALIAALEGKWGKR